MKNPKKSEMQEIKKKVKKIEKGNKISEGKKKSIKRQKKKKAQPPQLLAPSPSTPLPLQLPQHRFHSFP